MKLVREVRWQIRVVEFVTSLAAEVAHALERVRFEAIRRAEMLPAGLLLLHQEVVPNTSLPVAMGCAQRWNERQACFEPVVDECGGSTVPDVFIADDGAGIAGADAAAEQPRAALKRALRGRPFLDALYRPADAFRMPRETRSSAAARKSRRDR